MDPSCFLTATKSNAEQRSWWLDYSFNLEKYKTIQEQITWLQNQDMPPFEELLIPKDQQGQFEWLILHGYMQEEKKPPKEFYQYPRQNVWFHVDSVIIRKNNYQTLRKRIAKNRLQCSDICSPPNTYLTFLGEYPWHCSQKRTGRGYWEEIKRIVPTSCYFWESHLDFTMTDSLSLCFYLPSKWLVERFNLRREEMGYWYDTENKLVFFDPSITKSGPSCALVRKSSLLEMLEEDGLQLVWLVNGEKNLYPYDFNDSSYHGPSGRYILSGLYTLSPDGIISGDYWFAKEFTHNI
jgi:hypothetical protein